MHLSALLICLPYPNTSHQCIIALYHGLNSIDTSLFVILSPCFREDKLRDSGVEGSLY